MKQVPGYTLVRTEDCPEQHGTLTVLTHDVSGATILLVENEDNNKAFGIGFGTFPSDDTGVFHILEHSVLAGSEKYPVTSPFLQLLKSSMASFLNAMTFPDKTVYCPLEMFFTYRAVKMIFAMASPPSFHHFFTLSCLPEIKFRSCFSLPSGIDCGARSLFLHPFENNKQ